MPSSFGVRIVSLSLLALLVAGRAAFAAPIHVLAASELFIAPTLGSDGRSLAVEVRLRDDRDHPVMGQPVRLVEHPEGSRVTGHDRVALTDDRGVARFALALDTDVRVHILHATFGGTAHAAAVESDVRVDLDTAFVSLTVTVPTLVDLDGDGVDVPVLVSSALPRSPAGLEVALFFDERQVAGPSAADETGHITLHVGADQLGSAGVRAVRAEFQQGGVTVTSPTRRLVVRARTTLLLTGVDRADTTPLLVGTLATRFGGVAREPVRILWGTRPVGAVLTGDDGSFRVALDGDIVGRPGVSVRATFMPTEPWFTGSTSAPLVLTPPEPTRIPWTFVAAPLALALLVLAVARAALGRDAPRAAISMPSLGDATVARVADASDGSVRLRLTVVDRATREPIEAATVAWRIPTRDPSRSEDVVTLPGAGRFEVELTAPGYAPRTLAGELPRGGEYGVNVPLRGWREELFERARVWMRRAGAVKGAVFPTLREVLDARGGSVEAEAWVTFLERGTYGPVPPDARLVDEADRRQTISTPRE